MRKLIYTRILN